MIRRSGFITVVGSALVASACGRQVTPAAATGPGSAVPSGFMQVKFRTVQPFNFSTYSYAMVFNTSGDGKTPIAYGVQNGYDGYSFAIIVGGAGGSVSATAWVYLRQQQNQQPVLQQIFPLQQDLQFFPNSNGQGTEFTVLFNRLQIAGVTVLTSATPSPTPTATATATPTPTPSPTPTATATGTATPTPAVTPTPNFAMTWYFNFFVANGAVQNGGTLVLEDSLGHSPTGPTDTTYVSPAIDTLTTFDTGPFYPTPGTPPADPTGTIASGDIITTA